jgi:DNA-binding winged helix-turn-helix (wHTH) protein
VGHNVLFLFNNYVLDGQRRELRSGGIPVALEPQVFDLLVYSSKTVIASSARMI